VVALLIFAPLAYAQDNDHQHDQREASPASNVDRSSEAEHVAPEPPQQIMGDMPYRSMVAVMQMDDTALVGRVMFDQLEWRNTGEGDAAVWDAKASYGGDYNKALLKTEGEYQHDAVDDARVELLWDRVFSRWWSAQVGMREDLGEGPSRSWVAFGVEGLAPYCFDVEATAYVGDAGRTALRFHVKYDLLITQRLILRSELEANLYGKSDPERQLGAGLSDAQFALRLRYEIRREFAPYIGIAWRQKFAGTGDYAEAAGLSVSDVQALAGIRVWF
jgi:copper resistance protein B